MDHGRNQPLDAGSSKVPNRKFGFPRKHQALRFRRHASSIPKSGTATISGWWLTYPSEYEFVSWDDEIPNIWKVIKFHGSKPPTRFYRASITSGSSSHSLPWFDMLNSPSNHRPQLCLSSLPLESGIQTLSNMAADVHAFGSHSEPINFETSWAEYSGNSAYLTYDDAPEVNCIMVIIVEISSLQQLRVEVANRLRASEYHIYPWSDLEKHGEVCKCCLKNHILSLFITEIGRQIYVSIHIYQFKMHEYVYIYTLCI